MTINRREFGLVSVGLAVSGGAALAKPPTIALLVPAYFYPAGEGRKTWDRMIASATQAPIVAIANPDSGPGVKRDPNYTEVLDRALKGGVTLIGYVSTRYGQRTVGQARADMDRWLALYPQIRGFFLDEQSSDVGKLNHYAALGKHARRVAPKGRLVANPGTICDERYIAERTSDVFCLFENRQGFDVFQPPPWAAKYPSDRFAVIPYAIEGEAAMRVALKKAVGHRIGSVFVTDAMGANPYDRLPRYWEPEVRAIATVNGN
ncbi:MAG: hypothetical protein JWN86_1160 [Planctomycetota bacterium]|nr:hypothetical protein [Planctomycetota bacterium]